MNLRGLPPHGRPGRAVATIVGLLLVVGGQVAAAATPIRTCITPLPDGSGDRYLRKVPNDTPCRPGERLLEWGRNVPQWKDVWSADVSYNRSEAVSFGGSS